MPFLLIALVVAVVGVAILVLRNREPRSMEAGIDDYERRRDALRPPEHDEHDEHDEFDETGER